MVKFRDISPTLPTHPRLKAKERDSSQIKTIVVHCTDINSTPKKIAAYDVSPRSHLNPGIGAPTCSYHDIIMKDGTIYQCVPYTKITWHASGHNRASVSISLMYKTGNDEAPTKCQMEALVCRLFSICLYLQIPPQKIFGHRELKGTGWIFDRKGHKRLRKTCPGMLVDLEKLRKEICIKLQKRLKKEKLYGGQIDGIFGPFSSSALKDFGQKLRLRQALC